MRKQLRKKIGLSKRCGKNNNLAQRVVKKSFHKERLKTKQTKNCDDQASGEH